MFPVPHSNETATIAARNKGVGKIRHQAQQSERGGRPTLYEFLPRSPATLASSSLIPPLLLSL